MPRVHEGGFVVLEFLAFLFRKLFPGPVIGRGEVLIELPEAGFAADRLFVGETGIAAIEALAGCGRGANRSCYQQRGKSSGKEMRRQGSAMLQSRHHHYSAWAVRAHLSPDKHRIGPNPTRRSMNNRTAGLPVYSPG